MQACLKLQLQLRITSICTYLSTYVGICTHLGSVNRQRTSSIVTSYHETKKQEKKSGKKDDWLLNVDGVKYVI